MIDLYLSKQIPLKIREELVLHLERTGLIDGFVAVRSSGLDEDSGDNSFAGQFSSFLFKRDLMQFSRVSCVVGPLVGLHVRSHTERNADYR